MPPIKKLSGVTGMICFLIKQARNAAFLEVYVKCFYEKKWGILIKKESGSLEFTGLEIPRDYNYILEENLKDTNDYGSFADIPRNQTLVVVEGDFEKKTVLNLLCNCFPQLNIQKENIHVYGAKIYDLYHLIELEYGDDWFEQNVDIDIPLLISRREGISPVLDQRKFTNIYLIFDYEHHDNLYSDEKIERMQRHFDSASDDGMLYINYPMIESFIDVKSFAEEEYINKYISPDS